MRSKLISIVAAVVMAASVMLAFNTAPAQSAAKVKHDLVITGAGEIKNTGRFYVKGKVSTYTKRKVILQRKVGRGAFKLYKRMPTNNKGKFSTQFDGPVGSCFKVVVPGTKNYKKTSKRIGCIVRA
jgi:hypothetical protein